MSPIRRPSGFPRPSIGSCGTWSSGNASTSSFRSPTSRRIWWRDVRMRSAVTRPSPLRRSTRSSVVSNKSALAAARRRNAGSRFRARTSSMAGRAAGHARSHRLSSGRQTGAVQDPHGRRLAAGDGAVRALANRISCVSTGRPTYLTRYPSLIQERIVGPGIGVFVLCDHGRLLAAFAHRRLREKPPSGGASVLCESVAVDPGARATGARGCSGRSAGTAWR